MIIKPDVRVTTILDIRCKYVWLERLKLLHLHILFFYLLLPAICNSHNGMDMMQIFVVMGCGCYIMESILPLGLLFSAVCILIHEFLLYLKHSHCSFTSSILMYCFFIPFIVISPFFLTFILVMSLLILLLLLVFLLCHPLMLQTESVKHHFAC